MKADPRSGDRAWWGPRRLAAVVIAALVASSACGGGDDETKGASASSGSTETEQTTTTSCDPCLHEEGYEDPAPGLWSTADGSDCRWEIRDEDGRVVDSGEGSSIDMPEGIAELLTVPGCEIWIMGPPL